MELPRQGRASRRDATGDRRTGDGDAPLFPFPEGWNFVADGRSLAKEGLIQKQGLGQDIVAWSDGTGAVCATPFGPPPPSAKLTVFETREILGLVFAWWGIGGRPPQRRLPDDPPAGNGWGGQDIRTIRFAGHPQETTENSVDLAHLRYVHGYDAVKPVGETTVDGAYLLTRFDFKRRRRIAGSTDPIHDISATAHIHGPGYSFVDVVDLVLVSQMRELRKPRRLISGLGFLPVKLRTRLMNRILSSSQERDVRQDVTIWGNKRYRPRPRLSRSDGEIGRYRRHCRQFCPRDRDGGWPAGGPAICGDAQAGEAEGAARRFRNATHLEGAVDRWAKSRSASKRS